MKAHNNMPKKNFVENGHKTLHTLWNFAAVVKLGTQLHKKISQEVTVLATQKSCDA